MGMILCILIFGVIIFLICLLAYNQKKEQKELSFSSQAYGGPAGEPLWEGKLPSKADDYTEPRYVYENLVESLDYLPENGRIIGYRISPELVIHSRIHPSLNPPRLSDYISRYGGKLLETDEAYLLLQNWDKVFTLREKAGDTPLDVKSFFALSPQKTLIGIDVPDGTYLDLTGIACAWGALILKR